MRTVSKVRGHARVNREKCDAQPNAYYFTAGKEEFVYIFKKMELIHLVTGVVAQKYLYKFSMATIHRDAFNWVRNGKKGVQS